LLVCERNILYAHIFKACAAAAIFSVFGVVILTFFGILIVTDSKSFAIVDSISEHKVKKSTGCFIAAGLYLVVVIATVGTALYVSIKMKRSQAAASFQ
jgi:ABC-type multidrug transport system fused ATPase/permease subunit